MIAILVDGPANGQQREVPDDTWIIEGWVLGRVQYGPEGEPIDNGALGLPARYIRVGNSRAEYAQVFEFEHPRIW